MRPEDYARARELFHELFELAPAERRAAIDERVLPDGVRELVAGLFEREDARGEREDLGLASVGSALFVATLSNAQTLGAPKRIGAYRILQLLGEGGMGTVYEARHDEAGRTVALKVLRHGPRTRSELGRFLREAELLRQLRHPGIAHFYDAGSAPADGAEGVELPYLAMERVVGRPLAEHADRAKLGDAARVELFARVCDAVEHAHRFGVVHRDLKPENVLVVEEERGPGRPKVLDFGVARAAGLELATLTETGSGILIGTLPYMSPEQVAGDAKRVDARSDVYALGVLLYELLSGVLPYDVRQRPLPDVARVIWEEEPRRLGSVAARFRGNLELIVGKALEKEPARRYASAGELAADLRRHLAGRAITARRPSWNDLARRFARRHRTLVVAAAGTLAALLVGLIATSVLAFREAAARREADRNAALSLRNAYRGRIAAATAAVDRQDVAEARLQLDEAPEGLRGWEWSHLASRLDDSLARRAFEAAPDRSRFALAFTEDAQRVRFVPPVRDGETLRLGTWSWRTGASTERLLDASDVAVVLDPTGEWLALGTDAPRLERAEDGSQRILFPEFSGALKKLELSPGAERAVFVAGDRIDWFRRADGRLEAASCDLDGRRPFVLDERGESLAQLAGDRLRIAPLAPGSEVRELVLPTCTELLAYSASQERAALLGTVSSSVRIADTSAGARPGWIGAMQDHSDSVNCSAISPDGQRIATAGRDRVLRLWKLSDGSSSRRLAGHVGIPQVVRFCADGSRVASYGDDGHVAELCVWDTALVDPRTWPHGCGVLAVAFAAHGACALTGDVRGRLRLFDASSSRELARAAWPASYALVLSIATDPDDRWWAIALREETAPRRKRIVVLDPWTGAVLANVRTPDLEDGALKLTARADGERLAVQEMGTTLTVWDTRDWQPLASIGAGPSVPGSGPAWSPDGRRIATTPSWNEIAILDAEDLRELGRVETTDSVRDLAFAPMRNRLAVAPESGGIEVWELGPALRRVLSPEGTTTYRNLAYSPDGLRLFAVGRSRSLDVWDPANGDLLARFVSNREDVISFALSPDGKRVVTVSGDGTAHVCDADTTATRVLAGEAWEATAARVGPTVDGWFDALGGHGARDRIRAEPAWDEREREVALELVHARALRECAAFEEAR